MSRLTKRGVDAAKARTTDYFLWCSATPGFGVRIHPSGKKIFVVQVRVGRRQRRVKLGPYGAFTVEQARNRAEGVIRDAADGRDPQLAKLESRTAITVAELCDLYLEAARAGLVMTRFRRPKRQTTIAIDEGRVSRHIKPLIGHVPARLVTRALTDDIARGKTAGVFPGKPRGRAVVTGGTKTAARVVELLGGIYSWAEKRGEVPGPNPIRGVETVRGEPKDRVLDPEELAALGNAARNAEQTSQAALAVRLIALTGLRREEACSLKWRDVDQEGHCIQLQTSKTGRSVRPVGQSVMKILELLRNRALSNWVFPKSEGEWKRRPEKKYCSAV